MQESRVLPVLRRSENGGQSRLARRSRTRSLPAPPPTFLSVSGCSRFLNPLRYRCAWDARLTTEVLRAFLRSLFADQRRRARRHFGIPRGQCGSVTFIQRFGSALNLTPHFHVLVLDGVYPGPAQDLGSFVPLPPPETEDVARVLAGTARRILRIVERRGLDSSEDTLASDEPLLALLTGASIMF